MKILQKMIELKYSKKNIGDVVRAEVDAHSNIIQEMVFAINAYRYGEYSYKSKIIRMLELKPTSLEIAIELTVLVLPIKEVSPIQSLCSMLGSQLGYENSLDGIKTAAEIIAVCESTELYSIYHSSDHENDTGTLGIMPNYEISDSVKNFIRETKYLPPMVCKPLPWVSRKGGGHLSGSGSMLLKKINQNDEEQCLQVLNVLQDIPWELNIEMLEFEENSKKALDTREKQSSFERLRTDSEHVYRDLLDQGNKFYFVWKRDSRGRSYSQGYHVNMQGNEYRKSIINFANKELLTDEVLV